MTKIFQYGAYNSLYKTSIWDVIFCHLEKSMRAVVTGGIGGVVDTFGKSLKYATCFGKLTPQAQSSECNLLVPKRPLKGRFW